MSSRAKRVTHPVERYDWKEASSRPVIAAASSAAHAVAVERVGQVGQVGLVGQVGQVGQVRRVGEDANDDLQNHAPRLAALERDAFTKGYAQGERAGGEAASKRADATLRRLAQTVEELGSLKNDLLRRTEHQVVQLSMAIAHRMLQRELNTDRGMLLAMARVALDRLAEHTAATIRLHPDDFAIVMSARDAAQAVDHIQVVADAVVSRGGCLVQADFGLMDVGLEAQFSELAHALLDGDAEGQAVSVAEPALVRQSATVHA